MQKYIYKIENMINHNQSIGGFLETLINDLPAKMQQTMNIIDANKDKFPEVERLANLATATGMNNGGAAISDHVSKD